MTEATDEYFSAQDTVGEWLQAACEVGPQYTVQSAALYKSWSDYCRATGDVPGSQVRFADEQLKRRGFDKRHGMLGKTWHGLRLKPIADPAADRSR